METGKQISVNADKSFVDCISVIIPAFNIEKYISSCLESVLKQTYNNMEIIVIDDGSTDNTGIIVDRFCEQYPGMIRCIHQENSGVTAARLKGVMNARGNWIGFVDGDDEIEPDMYERLFKNAEVNHADISHCGYQLVINGGKKVHYFHNTGQFKIQDRVTGLKDLLEGIIIEPSLCNKLYKRHLFQNILNDNLIDTSLKINEDLLINFYLFNVAKISVYEDFCSYHYLARAASATRSGFNVHKYLNQLSVRSTILEQVIPELKDIATKKLLYVCINGYAALIDKEAYRKEAEQFRKTMKQYRVSWKLLEKKDQLKIIAVYYAPNVYKKMYSLYRRHFGKKKYG